MSDANAPVDVATGDLLLAETDVTLPGVLPLVLGRAHRSSQGPGRWFGRSWMSSLDQRLLVTEERVYAGFADGQMLTWLTSGGAGSSGGSGELAALPVTGPAWPLRQNPDGSHTVSDRQRGLTWRFEPHAGYAEGELPLVSITDRAGHEIAFSHDETGRPLAVVHSGGYRILVEVAGERVSALTLAGRDGGQDIPLRRFEYDRDGNLSGVIGSSGLPRRFTYDEQGRVTGRTDGNGHSHRHTFDAEGRCVRIEGPNGVVSDSYVYEPGSTRHTAAGGPLTVSTIAESGRVVAVTDPIGKTARADHDERGRLTSRTDPLGRVTRYAYDERGNLAAVTDPEGRQTLVEADDACLPARMTGPDSGVWLQTFDKNGNVTELTAPDGSVLKNAYDSRGHLTEVVGADGAVTTMECDAAGLPVAVTTPAGETTRYERDPLGRIVRVLSSAGGVTAYTWTTDGLPLSRTLPDGSTESWAWDGEQNLVRRVSATGAVTAYSHDQSGRLAAIAWPGGTLSELHYDESSCLLSVTHGGLSWRFEHDSGGRMLAHTDYNGATNQLWYDPAGQLFHRVNPSGHESTYGYSKLGKLATQHTADGTMATFEYDAAGRLVRVKNDESDLVFVRDALGRVISESCDGRTVTRTYDAAGKVTSRVTPSGATTAWAYNAAGLPSALTADGRELRFEYDPAGRETRRDLPGGAVLAQRRDQLGRLVAQDLTGPAASAGPAGSTAAGRQLQRRAYTYNPDGFVTASADLLAGDRTFRLDAVGRVTAVAGAEGWSERYDYDAVGNIVDAAWPASFGGATAGAPDASAQGPRTMRGTLTTRAGAISYRHDAAGRVITRTRTPSSGDPETWRYTWDAESRLYTVELPDGTKWRYQYDPIGRRIGKRHLAADGELLGQTWFSWDGAVLAEQEDVHGDSETVTTWNYRADSPIPLTQSTRTVVRGGAEQGSAGEEFYSVVTDLSGVPTELVSEDGTVANHQQRTWWGLSAWQRDAATTPLRFPGQYYDEESGLYYDNDRYYDPETGAYLSAHPLGPISVPNAHSYVPALPASGDPLGLLSQEEAVWAKTADTWIGSVLLLARRRLVATGIDAFDPRLYAGEGQIAAE